MINRFLSVIFLCQTGDSVNKISTAVMKKSTHYNFGELLLKVSTVILLRCKDYLCIIAVCDK